MMKSKIEKVKANIKTLPVQIKLTMQRSISELLFKKTPSEFVNIVKDTWTQNTKRHTFYVFPSFYH
jgi:hypothetical protein